jgi:glycosyltransferase involved in cell wall biosynthesis
MHPKITFLICSWKAPASLELTLESISRQANKDLFETLLINNGFSDNRGAVLLEKFPDIHLRIVREPELGLARAVCTGFKNLHGEIVVKLDDDNTIDENFVSELEKLAEEYPKLGGVRPLIMPQWEEVVPPAWIQEIGTHCLSYTAKNRGDAPKETRYWPAEAFTSAPRPPGGGMIIHRDVVDCYMSRTDDTQRFSLDRVGNGLQGGQDYDIYHHVGFTNRGALDTPRLVVYHHIPRSRWKLGYLFRLNFNICYYCIRWELSFSDRKLRRVARESINFVRCMAELPYDGMVKGKPFLQCLCKFIRQVGWLSGGISTIGTK